MGGADQATGRGLGHRAPPTTKLYDLLPNVQEGNHPRAAGEGHHPPLFARYVFVLADQTAQQTVHTIRSTRGVSQLIKVGEQATLVKASIIDQIKALETEHLNQVKHHFTSNDKVVISQGLYQGLEAIYQMDKGLERSVVILNLLQRDTQLTLNKTQLKKRS